MGFAQAQYKHGVYAENRHKAIKLPRMHISHVASVITPMHTKNDRNAYKPNIDLGEVNDLLSDENNGDQPKQ